MFRKKQKKQNGHKLRTQEDQSTLILKHSNDLSGSNKPYFRGINKREMLPPMPV